MAVILINLGVMADQRENFTRVVAYAQNLKPEQALGAVNLGELAQKMGDYQRAITHFQSTLEILFALGDKLGCIGKLEHIAFWMIEMRQIEQASRLLDSVPYSRSASDSKRHLLYVSKISICAG